MQRFRKLVLLAAACHDLGKANNQFQALICGNRSNSTHRQAVRHEWVSWYILREAKFQDWFRSHLDEPKREIDWHILLWSVTGHHPSFGRDIPSASPNGSTDKLELLLSIDRRKALSNKSRQDEQDLQDRSDCQLSTEWLALWNDHFFGGSASRMIAPCSGWSTRIEKRCAVSKSLVLRLAYSNCPRRSV